MKISTSISDDTLVVALAGTLDTLSLLSIGTELKQVIEASDLDVILELSALDAIDDTGINVVLALHAWLDERDRDFVLAAPKGPVVAVLRRRQVDKQISVMKSVDDALNMVCPTMEFPPVKEVRQTDGESEFTA